MLDLHVEKQGTVSELWITCFEALTQAPNNRLNALRHLYKLWTIRLMLEIKPCSWERLYKLWTTNHMLWTVWEPFRTLVCLHKLWTASRMLWNCLKPSRTLIQPPDNKPHASKCSHAYTSSGTASHMLQNLLEPSRMLIQAPDNTSHAQNSDTQSKTLIRVRSQVAHFKTLIQASENKPHASECSRTFWNAYISLPQHAIQRKSVCASLPR